MGLTCPKCQGEMRNYERNGVHVDQCTECRGIFLDRGELEQLLDAERNWLAQTRPVGAEQEEGSSQSSGGLGAIVGEVIQQARGHKQGGYSKYDDHRDPRRKRKESFLGDLFG